MIQDQATQDPVERRASEWKPLGQVVPDELHRFGAGLGPRALQHGLRKIQSRYLTTCVRQPECMSASATSDVRHFQPRYPADQRPNVLFLKQHQRIFLMIINLSPAV